MRVFILIVLCLTATVVIGQGESDVSGRTENEEGYGPDRVNAPPSAPVTIPTTATVAANAYSAAFVQSPPVETARLPQQSAAAVQPPMMLMPYSFEYGVDDDESGLDFGHKESSDGAVVTGTYYVQLPDGRMETVNYKADVNGYVAEVSYEGEAKYGNSNSQKGAGSSSGASAQLQAPKVPAPAPAPPTRPSPPLPISTAAPKVPATTPKVPATTPKVLATTSKALAPVWPAVKEPVVPLAPTVDPTPSIIPATASPVAAPAPAPITVPAPTPIWTQALVSPPVQLSQVTTAQAGTPPAGLARSAVQQPEVQAISYGQPLPSIPAPVPAYPTAPIPLNQRNNTSKPVANPQSV